MNTNQWTEPERLLREWLQRARESQHSHHESGKSCRNLNYAIAVPIILITALLGTAAFATAQNHATGITNYIFGSLSFVAAALTALQVNLRLTQRSEQHQTIGAKYGNIRREIEQILAVPEDQREAPNVALSRIRHELDAISGDGDVVSRRIFERTQRRLKRNDTAHTSAPA
jgi:hypothetical protein